MCQTCLSAHRCTAAHATQQHDTCCSAPHTYIGLWYWVPTMYLNAGSSINSTLRSHSPTNTNTLSSATSEDTCTGSNMQEGFNSLCEGEDRLLHTASELVGCSTVKEQGNTWSVDMVSHT
jgi:hypothetical protein